MLYQFKINGVSNSGKPKVDFYCAHCGLIDLYMDGIPVCGQTID